jgi:hypothetical protein
MTRIIRSSLKLGNQMWELFAAATGGFMFVRGFGLVSRGNRRLDGIAPDRVAGPTFKPSSGVGIAIFLLVCVGGEAVTAVYAFRHESHSVASIPRSSAVLSRTIAVPDAMPEKQKPHRTRDRAGQAIVVSILDKPESQTGVEPGVLPHLTVGASLPSH